MPRCLQPKSSASREDYVAARRPRPASWAAQSCPQPAVRQPTTCLAAAYSVRASPRGISRPYRPTTGSASSTDAMPSSAQTGTGRRRSRVAPSPRCSQCRFPGWYGHARKKAASEEAAKFREETSCNPAKPRCRTQFIICRNRGKLIGCAAQCRSDMCLLGHTGLPCRSLRLCATIVDVDRQFGQQGQDWPAATRHQTN